MGRTGTKRIRRCELCDSVLTRVMFHSDRNFLRARFCSLTHRERYRYLQNKFSGSRITPSGFGTTEGVLDVGSHPHLFSPSGSQDDSKLPVILATTK